MGTYLAPELFACTDPLLLAGSCCAACGGVQFPAAAQCASCAGDTTEPITLPDRGTVWTWTVQRFPPKPPYEPPASGFVPFAVGYVDLGRLLVESIIVGDIGQLAIGDPVQLISHPLAGPDDALAFAFRR